MVFLSGMYMLAMVVSLEVICVYLEKLYFCVDDLWRIDVCECDV